MNVLFREKYFEIFNAEKHDFQGHNKSQVLIKKKVNKYIPVADPGDPFRVGTIICGHPLIEPWEGEGPLGLATVIKSLFMARADKQDKQHIMLIQYLLAS